MNFFSISFIIMEYQEKVNEERYQEILNCDNIEFDTEGKTKKQIEIYKQRITNMRAAIK